MTWKGAFPLIAFLGMCLIFAVGLTRDPRILPSEMIDRPLPEFQLSSLPDPNVIYSSDDLKGDIVLLNIFGSWCVACVQEHPMLIEISRQNEVRLVGVDWRDTRENATRWLAKYGNPYETILFDETSEFAINLGVTGAPESFLVDANGNIRYKHVGIITPEVWAETLLPMIQTLRTSS